MARKWQIPVPFFSRCHFFFSNLTVSIPGNCVRASVSSSIGQKFSDNRSKILGFTTLGIMTSSIMTFIIMTRMNTTLSIMTLHNDAQYNDAKHYDAQHNDTKHNDTQHNDIQHNDIQHNETHHNDTQHNDTQHNSFSLLTFRIMTLSMKGLYATVSINNTQHNNTLPLCLVSLSWVSRFIYYYAECHCAECCYAESRGAKFWGDIHKNVFRLTYDNS